MEVCIRNRTGYLSILIIESHWHFDHVGDSSKFPNSVEIIVGAGFVEELLPGYPTNPKSPLLETDYMYVYFPELQISDSHRVAAATS